MVKLVRPRSSSDVPTVTVVVPCYNYGRYLPQLVASVLQQPGVDPRVIIVDDASTDGSHEVARRLADGDSRVSVINHASNRGHIATYNDGLAVVETEYVTLVSADDVVAPGALARATDLMSAFPSVGLVYGITKSFSDVLPTTGTKASSWLVWPGHQWLRVACRLGRNFIMSPEVVLRTEAVRAAGGYEARLPHSADLAYWLRVAAEWDIGRVNGCVQAYYRVHSSNMHLTTFATMPVDLRHRRAAFATLREPWAAPVLDHADELVSLADRALAAEARHLARRDLDSGRSVEIVEELLRFAAQAEPTSADGRFHRRLARRVARAQSGRPPSRAAVVSELTRRQTDRVRWKVLNGVGLS